MMVYLQRLGCCEECAGGNKPSKVNPKIQIENMKNTIHTYTIHNTKGQVYLKVQKTSANMGTHCIAKSTLTSVDVHITKMIIFNFSKWRSTSNERNGGLRKLNSVSPAPRFLFNLGDVSLHQCWPFSAGKLPSLGLRMSRSLDPIQGGMDRRVRQVFQRWEGGILTIRKVGFGDNIWETYCQLMLFQVWVKQPDGVRQCDSQ